MGGDQTLNALETAWRREPQAVFVRLADAYRKGGAPDRAVSVLRDGLSRWPRNLAARVALAQLLLEQEDIEEATAELAGVLRAEPEHWAALELMASVRRQQGDRRGELELLEELARLGPGRRAIERRLDLARRELAGRPAMALRQPGQEWTVDPSEHPRPRGPSGPPGRVSTVPSSHVPQREHRTEPSGALPGLRRSSLPPPVEDPFLNDTMVDLLVGQGRLEEAEQLSARLDARRPGRPNIQQRLAELSAGGGLRTEASPTELEELMQSVLSAAAIELDGLTEPIALGGVGDE